MKNRRIFNFAFLTILVIVVLFDSCKKDDNVPAPTISGFSPDNGSKGIPVTITGSNFSTTLANNIVKFNGTPADVTAATQTSITTAVPSGASTGKISVTVGSNTATSTSDFQVFNSPEISSFSPASGLPGTSIIITGKNYSSTIANNLVLINNLQATVTAATTTSLTISVPTNATTGKISITINGLTTSSNTDFIVPPTITDFAPTSGIIGSTVVITGTGFSTVISNNEVKFSGKSATVNSATATSLNVVVPSDAVMDKITITVSGQTATSAQDFAIVPTISDFSPKIGAVGSTVVITGTGFSSAVPANNIVKFGTVTASVSTATGTSLSVIVPAGGTTGNISVALGSLVEISSSNYQVAIEAVSAGGTDFDEGYSVAVDGSGNTFITGSFRSSVNFGSTVINSAGSDDIYIAKYDSNYDLQWVKQAGGSSADYAYSIAVDANGNSFITGMFNGTSTFGSTILNSNGFDPFIAKFNSSGDCVWASRFGSFSSNAEQGFMVKVDASGNPYVIGSFADNVTVGTTLLTSVGNTDVFVVKYDPSNGAPIWAKSFGGSDSEQGMAVNFNSVGEIYVSGTFFGSTQIGSYSLTSVDEGDAFVAKLTSSGDVVWAKQISGPSNDLVYSLAVDASDNLYVGGLYAQSVSLGSTNLTAVGNEDILLAKYSSAGDLVWAKSVGGSDYDAAKSIAIDASGNIYVTGYFTRTASFQGKPLTSSSTAQDLFVAKFNSNGDVLWANKVGSQDYTSGQGIVVDASGTISIVGSFRQTTTFGSTTEQSAGNDDIFLWRSWQ